MYDISVCNWKWNSQIIKITGGQYTKPDIQSIIAQTEKADIRTLHIHIQETILADWLKFLIDAKYIFRSYDDGFYGYYKWLLPDVEDKVHPYATSTAGASALILSPDESSVLMVYENDENDLWKLVTGSNDYNELSKETACREMMEEVGLEFDTEFEPRVVGLWNIKSKHGTKINDVMTCYVLRSKNDNFKIDEFELKAAAWIKIEELMKVVELLERPITKPIDKPLNLHKIKFEERFYGYPYLVWIGNWISGKYFDVNLVENVNVIS